MKRATTPKTYSQWSALIDEISENGLNDKTLKLLAKGKIAPDFSKRLNVKIHNCASSLTKQHTAILNEWVSTACPKDELCQKLRAFCAEIDTLFFYTRIGKLSFRSIKDLFNEQTSKIDDALSQLIAFYHNANQSDPAFEAERCLYKVRIQADNLNRS